MGSRGACPAHKHSDTGTPKSQLIRSRATTRLHHYYTTHGLLHCFNKCIQRQKYTGSKMCHKPSCDPVPRRHSPLKYTNLTSPATPRPTGDSPREMAHGRQPTGDSRTEQVDSRPSGQHCFSKILQELCASVCQGRAEHAHSCSISGHACHPPERLVLALRDRDGLCLLPAALWAHTIASHKLPGTCHTGETMSALQKRVTWQTEMPPKPGTSWLNSVQPG